MVPGLTGSTRPLMRIGSIDLERKGGAGTGIVAEGRRGTAWKVRLLGKLHSVTPLCHVLDFFTLVDLMNQTGGVID